jgi:hypothetical protein
MAIRGYRSISPYYSNHWNHRRAVWARPLASVGSRAWPDLLVSRAALQSGPLVRSSTAIPWWLAAGLAAGFREIMTRPPGVRGRHLTCGRTA